VNWLLDRMRKCTARMRRVLADLARGSVDSSCLPVPQVYSAALCLVLTLSLRAGVVYDSATNTMVVDNYPEAVPCTPHVLARVDRFNGWDKVRIDDTGMVVTVGCHLQIGLNSGHETHFQLGDEGRPRETLVVDGHVIVHPFHIHGLNEWIPERRVIRLQLGKPDAPSVRPTLRISAGDGRAHGLYINRIPLPDGTLKHADVWSVGGQLHVYGGTITAASPNRAHAFGGRGSLSRHVLMYGDSVVLRNATMSWFKGVATFGLQKERATVENTVFEYGSCAMINGGWVATGCVFRHLDRAIGDYGGALNARLVNCRFENNTHNIVMRFRGSRVVAVDCEFGTPAKPDSFVSRYARKEAGPTPPMLVLQRHVRIRTVDARGDPVPGVKISASCRNPIPGDVMCVSSWEGKTGQDGVTPGPAAQDAVLLTESRMTVGATPTEPLVTVFSYRIAAERSGWLPVSRSEYRPTSSWETVTLVLQKK
jgi:hypothetical protein